MSTPNPIRCTGRPVDDHGRPVGDPCGKVYHPPCLLCRHRDPALVEQHATAIAEQARAAGWRLAPIQTDGTRPAACPACSRPDPTTTALCRDLQKGPTRP